MTHEIFYLQQQSHETLTLILVGGCVSSAIVLAFALYLHWRVATPAKLHAWRVKSARRRDGDDGVDNDMPLPNDHQEVT